MNWSKVLMGGIVAGIVGNLANFVMHGFIMADTYVSNPAVFTQEEASPAWFFLVSICLWVAAAMLFGRTRSSWAAGAKGGATFGFFLALVGFFAQFINPLVIADFPYYLAWCWGGILVIAHVIAGAALGLVYKEA